MIMAFKSCNFCSVPIPDVPSDLSSIPIACLKCGYLLPFYDLNMQKGYKERLGYLIPLPLENRSGTHVFAPDVEWTDADVKYYEKYHLPRMTESDLARIHPNTKRVFYNVSSFLTSWAL